MLTGRGIRRLAVVATVVTILAVAGPPTLARAQADCGFSSYTAPNGDEVFVFPCESGGSGGGNGTWTCHTTAAGRQVRVPCVDPVFGWFTNAYGGCYIRPATPQPSAGHPAWDGNNPGDGLVYTAYCFAVDGVDGMPYVQLPTTLFLTAGEGPIAGLVEQAIARLPLRGPDIHTAPDPDGVGLVGLPVWMWTPASESTWGPATASLTSLGITVAVRADGAHITWDMGDGAKVVCDGPGTAYQPRYGAEDSPTCGHRYQQPSRGQPGGRYQVAATTDWRIQWQIEGTAISGTESTTRGSSTSLQIHELHVVTS